MATLLSANDWPVLDDAPPLYLVPGTTWKLRAATPDAAVIACWLFQQIDDLVEDVDTAHAFPADMPPAIAGGAPSDVFDDWSWVVRKVRGSLTSISNHSSATAWDVNATQHPRGVRGTWTKDQIREVRKLLAFLEGTVRWGEDYTTVIDGMHFELNEGARSVRRIADKIRDLSKPTPVPAVIVPEEEDDMLGTIAQEYNAAKELVGPVFLVAGNTKMPIKDPNHLAWLKANKQAVFAADGRPVAYPGVVLDLFPVVTPAA